MIYKFSSLSILLYRKGNLSSRLKVISSKGLSPVILLGVNSQRNEIAVNIPFFSINLNRFYEFSSKKINQMKQILFLIPSFGPINSLLSISKVITEKTIFFSIL